MRESRIFIFLAALLTALSGVQAYVPQPSEFTGALASAVITFFPQIDESITDVEIATPTIAEWSCGRLFAGRFTRGYVGVKTAVPVFDGGWIGCHYNPVNFVDPDGRDDYWINKYLNERRNDAAEMENKIDAIPGIIKDAALEAADYTNAGDWSILWSGHDLSGNQYGKIMRGVAFVSLFYGSAKAFGEARGLIKSAPKEARYIYDKSVGRYRDLSSGKFVSQSSLPYPVNSGFLKRAKGTIDKGDIIDRYGRPSGRFAGQPGSSISARGMPPGSEVTEYHKYEVLKQIEVELGPAAPVPEFGASGGATQYMFKTSIENLLKQGFLRELP